jgi:hypothetical protein
VFLACAFYKPHDKLYIGFINIFYMKFKLSVFSFLFLLPLSLYSAPTDFNNDGVSDISAVTIGDKLKWESQISGIKETIVSEFGVPGDQLVPGRYVSGATQPAVLKDTYSWRVYTEAGVKTFKHGEDNALFLAGADFDGDGITDAAYTTEFCSRKVSTAKIITNPLGTAPKSYSRTLGRGNSFKTFADVNNDGKDDICYTKAATVNGKIQSKFNLACYDVISGTKIDQFAIGYVFRTPHRLKTATGADHIVTLNPSSSKTIVNIFNTNGKKLKRFTFKGKGIILIGNFTKSTTETEQIAYAIGKNAKVYDLTSDTFTDVTAPEGIHFDDINIVDFKDDPGNNCQCSSKHIQLYGRCPSNTGCSINREISDGVSHGFLHKPISDTTGSIVELLPKGEIPDSCRYENTAGQLVKETYFSSIGNGDRAHYRPVGGGSCSSFPAPLRFSCSINGIRNCWTIPKPCVRYD